MCFYYTVIDHTYQYRHNVNVNYELSTAAIIYSIVLSLALLQH